MFWLHQTDLQIWLRLAAFSLLSEMIRQEYTVCGNGAGRRCEYVHWLRLMPYKIRKDKKLAAVFYAGLLYVLKDLREMGNL